MPAEEDEMAAAIWLAREDRGLAADEQDMLDTHLDLRGLRGACKATQLWFETNRCAVKPG